MGFGCMFMCPKLLMTKSRIEQQNLISRYGKMNSGQSQADLQHGDIFLTLMSNFKSLTMNFTFNVNITVDVSSGKTKSGEQVYFVKPSFSCVNRSRRCVGEKHLEHVIKKWFSPNVKSYAIGTQTIGSNSVEHAINEYYRVCPREEIGTVTERDVIELKKEE